MNSNPIDPHIISEPHFSFDGGFNGPMRIFSRSESVYDLKLIHEIVYDSVTKQQRTNKIGLFLIDDFETNSHSLFIICSATYGHPKRSQVHSDTYIDFIELNSLAFCKSQSVFVANNKWYSE